MTKEGKLKKKKRKKRSEEGKQKNKFSGYSIEIQNHINVSNLINQKCHILVNMRVNLGIYNKFPKF